MGSMRLGVEKNEINTTKIAIDALAEAREKLGFLIDVEYPIPGFIDIARGENLSWNYTADDRIVRPERRLLEDFVKLHTSESVPDRILGFARRYGTLGFCRSHFELQRNRKMLDRLMLSRMEGDPPQEGFEYFRFI